MLDVQIHPKGSHQLAVTPVLWCACLQADASPGSPTGAHGRGPRLYVGGVPDEITEEDIVEHFNKWGQVVDCYFPGAPPCIPWQTSSMQQCAEDLELTKYATFALCLL